MKSSDVDELVASVTVHRLPWEAVPTEMTMKALPMEGDAADHGLYRLDPQPGHNDKPWRVEAA
jgi:hypothetical protein